MKDMVYIKFSVRSLKSDGFWSQGGDCSGRVFFKGSGSAGTSRLKV